MGLSCGVGEESVESVESEYLRSEDESLLELLARDRFADLLCLRDFLFLRVLLREWRSLVSESEELLEEGGRFLVRGVAQLALLSAVCASNVSRACTRSRRVVLSSWSTVSERGAHWPLGPGVGPTVGSESRKRSGLPALRLGRRGIVPRLYDNIDKDTKYV